MGETKVDIELFCSVIEFLSRSIKDDCVCAVELCHYQVNEGLLVNQCVNFPPSKKKHPEVIYLCKQQNNRNIVPCMVVLFRACCDKRSTTFRARLVVIRILELYPLSWNWHYPPNPCLPRGNKCRIDNSLRER